MDSDPTPLWKRLLMLAANILLILTVCAILVFGLVLGACTLFR